ncbi:JNK1/MAPK8-associated membrane protein [Drosophila sulfurigaster albostrigata]|uniref:JNK1/MAPK8-associated membrane protein n=1 Tax=Drosophila sulfurigaster albostrigata TaxID=89887 RepID=UPI002D21A57E|nr:JNK1/MAPK8-associated membrane protein [Drosophila sulfurigaster albostrigata]
MVIWIAALAFIVDVHSLIMAAGASVGFAPRGSRVNASYACTPCRDELSTYSWLYLGFMTMLPLMMHCFFIDMDAKDRKFSRKQLILTASAFVEVALAAILATLFMEPMWELRLYACEVRKLTDWYTLFYNPNPNYEATYHCTQEAVYPLQTIVLVYYFLCLLNMFLIRPLISSLFDVRGKAPIYSALYFLPLLTLIHGTCCGLIYYSFPYLSIAMSMVATAIHYAMKLDQTQKALLLSSVWEMKNVVIISVHWLLLAFGIASLNYHYTLLCLVPFPFAVLHSDCAIHRSRRVSRD